LVKEADLLQRNGHQVTVLYCFYIDWAQNEDEELLKQVEWNYLQIGGSPKNHPFQYFITRLKYRIFKWLYKFLGNSFLLAERSQIRGYDELLKAARKIKADWYIGHGIGTMAVCVNAAGSNQAKAGFDYEDYHRGEVDRKVKEEIDRVRFLEEKYIPNLHYLTSASPMIRDAVKKDFPRLRIPICSIFNVFPKPALPNFNPSNSSGKLKLFWFSQTIGKGRGLEPLFKALIKLNDERISLSLVGRLDASFQTEVEETRNQTRSTIEICGIVPPSQLLQFSSNFDVGMALEIGSPENRELALTNKIFTYLQAGNAIILFNTKMQKQFNEELHCGIGVKVNDVEELCAAILFYCNKEHLLAQKQQNLMLAENVFNWEMESKKLLNYFNQQNFEKAG